MIFRGKIADRRLKIFPRGTEIQHGYFIPAAQRIQSANCYIYFHLKGSPNDFPRVIETGRVVHKNGMVVLIESDKKQGIRLF